LINLIKIIIMIIMINYFKFIMMMMINYQDLNLIMEFKLIK
jgi:hypothetical protein